MQKIVGECPSWFSSKFALSHLKVPEHYIHMVMVTRLGIYTHNLLDH